MFIPLTGLHQARIVFYIYQLRLYEIILCINQVSAWGGGQRRRGSLAFSFQHSLSFKTFPQTMQASR